jgi:hypothetical protein
MILTTSPNRPQRHRTPEVVFAGPDQHTPLERNEEQPEPDREPPAEPPLEPLGPVEVPEPSVVDVPEPGIVDVPEPGIVEVPERRL